MRRTCPECESHDTSIKGDECICDLCDATIDYKIDGVWASDTKSFNLPLEARVYNMQYHRYNPRAGIKKVHVR